MCNHELYCNFAFAFKLNSLKFISNIFFILYLSFSIFSHPLRPTTHFLTTHTRRTFAADAIKEQREIIYLVATSSPHSLSGQGTKITRNENLSGKTLLQQVKIPKKRLFNLLFSFSLFSNCHVAPNSHETTLFLKNPPASLPDKIYNLPDRYRSLFKLPPTTTTPGNFRTARGEEEQGEGGIHRFFILPS